MPGRDRVETLHHPDVRFTVRLTPRAVTDRVDGVLDGVLKARVTEPNGDVRERTAQFYGDWLAAHEREHIGQITQVLADLDHS